MANTKQTLVAREGWPLIGLLVAMALLVSWNIGWWTGVPLWVVAAGVSYLFRDPKRIVPPLPLAVISPVDGVVQKVGQIGDPCLERQAQRISLCMGIGGAYSVRSPIEGKVMQRWVEKLTGNCCDPDTANDALDDLGLWVQSDEQDDVVLLIPGGRALRSPRIYAFTGDRVGQGQRFGFIRLGSRVDVLVPPGSRVKVEPGERVRSGETVLAQLVHATAEDAVDSAVP